MRQTEGGIHLTARNQHIRMCIAKSLIELLGYKSLEDITITLLAKTAHVSRMTFYKYYVCKQDVLSDYMYELMSEYMEEAKKQTDIGHFREEKHICHCFKFFSKYSLEIETLVKANLYSVIINAVNDYMDTYILPNSSYSCYELYYYGGAICNTYIKWLEAGMAESPEEIARIVYRYLE